MAPDPRGFTGRCSKPHLRVPRLFLFHVRNDASVGPASNCPGLTLPPEGLDSQPGCFVSALVPRGELGAWAASSDPQLCAAFAGFAKALQLIPSKRLLHPLAVQTDSLA